MSQYTCLNCGYVFDESKGAPDSRIAPNYNALLKSGCAWHKNIEKAPPVIGILPGTKWEDVPQNFVCPSCNAGKDMFE